MFAIESVTRVLNLRIFLALRQGTAEHIIEDAVGVEATVEGISFQP